MDSPHSLREKARLLEQGGQDGAALDLYLRLANEATRPDPALIIRIANLHLKLGRPEQAVGEFLRCVDLLGASGLIHSALALLHRVVRISPDHAPAMLQLGRLSARAGHPADALDWYRRYVAHMRESGNADAGFDALREHLRSRPDDQPIRDLLIEQLQAHGRNAEAAEEARALEAWQRTADDEPDAGSSGPQPSQAPGSGVDEWLAEDGGVDELEILGSGWDGAGIEPQRQLEPESGLDLVPTRIDQPDASHLDADPVMGLEPTHLDGLESNSMRQDWQLPESSEVDDEPLALRGSVDDAPWGAEPQGGEGVPDDQGGDDLEDELPLLGVEMPPEERSAPPADVRKSPAPASGSTRVDPLLRAQARVAQNPADPGAHRELVEVLLQRGEAELLATALQDAHPVLAAARRFAEAAGMVEQLSRLRPDAADLLMLRVEYAVRSGDDRLAASALVALGEYLAGQAKMVRAREVFARALEIDPDNGDARRALGAFSAESPRD